MLNHFIDAFSYPMAILLSGEAIFILAGLAYYIRNLKKQGQSCTQGMHLTSLFYLFSVSLWVASNAYFHTSFLVTQGEEAAVIMGRLANIFSLFAFIGGNLLSCQLLAKIRGRPKIETWQSVLLITVTLFSLGINLLPGYTVTGAVIQAPGQFMLEFGPMTPPFFLSAVLLSTLTLVNMLRIRSSEQKVLLQKSLYVLSGVMCLFMLTTTMLHIVITLAYNDFSLTWLPPALSAPQLLLVCYAMLRHRFYTEHYLLYLTLILLSSVSLYLLPLLAVRIYISPDYILAVTTGWTLLFGCALCLKHQSLRRLASLIIYGEPLSPVGKILQLRQEFQHNSRQALSSLADLLQLKPEQSIWFKDAASHPAYVSYLNSHDSALLLDELSYHATLTRQNDLKELASTMYRSRAALLLPLYTAPHQTSELLAFPAKQDGSPYGYEEIIALQTLLDYVQPYIQAERQSLKAHALAKSIAHEMRNPLTQLQLHLERLDSMLVNKAATPLIREEIQLGRDAIQRGSQLIDMTLHEASHAQPEVELSVHRAADLIRSSVNQYAFESRSHSQRVALDVSNDFEVRVNDTLFGFVLFNLLRNALHYFNAYPDSHICISLDPGFTHNRLRFRDYGPGIEPQVAERIFEDFFTHQKQEGSGLGLGYCKRVMRMFNSEISCHSVPGEWTEFVLTFPGVRQQTNTPVSAAPASEACLAPGLRPGGIRVLIADDTPAQRTLVSLYLKQLGVKTVEAESGLAALDLISQHPVDMVLMDICMPGLDGFETTKQLKQRYPDLPVIALSGESGEQEVARITNLMDGRLVKPTTKLLLAETINKWYRKKTVLRDNSPSCTGETLTS